MLPDLPLEDITNSVHSIDSAVSSHLNHSQRTWNDYPANTSTVAWYQGLSKSNI